MRGDVVCRVYGVHGGRAEDTFFGAFRTRGEAERRAEELTAREMNGRNWAQQYHNRGFVIRETVVETDFEVPSLPTPRDKYLVRTAAVSNGPGTWPSTNVDVLRRGAGGPEHITSFLRNYSMLSTFEAFRQGNREFALVSQDYQATAVLDLQTGELVAEETGEQAGFCPVGFYVPDWWDVHDGSIIPGSESWRAEHEWPTGMFGFVWGCRWGDDGSWKVQHLDLSRVADGVITRDDRYGYVELDTRDWDVPWRDADRSVTSPRSAPPPFICITHAEGRIRVSFATRLQFDLATGQIDPWQLKTLTREESGPE